MPKSWQSRIVICLQRHLGFRIIGSSSVRTSEPRQQTSVTPPNTEWNHGNPKDSVSSYVMAEVLQQAPKLFFRGSPHITRWIARHCSPQPEKSAHRPLCGEECEEGCAGLRVDRDRNRKGTETERAACVHWAAKGGPQPRRKRRQGKSRGVKDAPQWPEPHSDHTPSLDNIGSFKNRQLSWLS